MVAVPSIGRAAEIVPHRGAPEADATRDLYERYARQIYAYCFHQLRNKEEAEDATQSTFLNAFRGLKRGVDPEFETAWLYKIAQNVCLTRQRSSSRRRRVETPGDLEAMQDYVPAHQVDPDELIDLPEALDAMPEQQRRALLMREWQGLSYKEIGEELGLSQAAVETLLFRARRTLAAGLGDESPKSIGKRLRAGGDAGSALALLKSLLLTGGAKVAATVATVAATSAVAASPAARHAVEKIVVPPPTPPAPRRTAPARPAALLAAAVPVAYVRPSVGVVQNAVHHVPVAHDVRKPAHVAIPRHVAHVQPVVEATPVAPVDSTPVTMAPIAVPPAAPAPAAPTAPAPSLPPAAAALSVAAPPTAAPPAVAPGQAKKEEPTPPVVASAPFVPPGQAKKDRNDRQPPTTPEVPPPADIAPVAPSNLTIAPVPPTLPPGQAKKIDPLPAPLPVTVAVADVAPAQPAAVAPAVTSNGNGGGNGDRADHVNGRGHRK